MSKTTLVAALAVGVAVAWYAGSPASEQQVLPSEAKPMPTAVATSSAPLVLKTSRLTDEDRELLQRLSTLSVEDVRFMADEERQALQMEMESLATRLPDVALNEPIPAGLKAPTVTASFRDGDAFHRGQGTVTLHEMTDGSHVVRLSEDFSVTNGLGLTVLLTASPLGDTGAGVVELGRLKGNLGAQYYPVPAGTDVDHYHAVTIHQEAFGVVVATARFP